MTAFRLRDAARAVMAAAILGLPGVALAQTSADAQEAKTTFSEFFAPDTPIDQRVRMLENGQRFEDLMARQERTPVAKETTAVASDVEVQGDHAVVTYTIELNGQPVLQNQRGQMVKENGRWKVSEKTFCDIEAMRGAPPTACSGS